VAYDAWEGEAVAYDAWDGEAVAYDAWDGEVVAYEVWEGEVVAYEVWEGEWANVVAAGKEDTDALLVRRPALAGGIGPPLLARIRLVAGPLLPPLEALDAAFFFSVLAFSSSSSCFRRSSSGNSASSLRSSTHFITARSADCSFLFTLLPDWPLLVLELSEATHDVFLESSR